MSTVNWTLTNGKYEISSLNHFLCFQKRGTGFTATGSVPAYSSASFIQTVNIDFAGLTMLPVPAFTGSYDGQNFELKNWKNLQSFSASSQAIFASTGTGTIKNIYVTGVFKSYGAGNCAIITGTSTGTIITNINCDLEIGSIIQSTSHRNGGISGYIDGGTIERIRIKGYLTIIGDRLTAGISGNANGTVILRDIIYSAIGDITLTGTQGFVASILCYFTGSTSIASGLINEMTGNINSNGGPNCAGIIATVVNGATVSSCINKMKGNITGPSVGGILSSGTIVQDCINIMEGNIVSTNGVGGAIGSSGTFIRNVVALKGNTLSILNTSVNTANVANNVYSNRFGMTVNNVTVTTSSLTNGTLVSLNIFPTTELTTNGTIQTFNSTKFVPVWSYTYTDTLGIQRTITSDDSSYITVNLVPKNYAFTFNWQETKNTYANIGIGTNNAIKTLDINGDINVSNNIYKNNQQLTNWSNVISQSNDIYYNKGNVGINKTPLSKLDVNGTVRAMARLTNSDMRLKKDIQDETLGLAFANKLLPKTFTYINNFEQSNVIHGFIAQDIANIDSKQSVNDIVAIDSDGFYNIDIASLVTPLINSIKELSLENDIITEQVNKLN